MNNKPFDYSWIVFIIIAIIVVVAFKPVMNSIKGSREKSDKTSMWAKGKVIFYDTKTWGRDNRSCAMCHTKDYTLQEGFTSVDMKDFKYVELKGLKKSYSLSSMGNPDKILRQINSCLSSGNRIEAGTMDMNNERWEPLLAWLEHAYG
jgi:hypothetical protein